jgi:hypothetical protein
MDCGSEVSEGPQVVGAEITNGLSYTVVGVMPGRLQNIPARRRFGLPTGDVQPQLGAASRFDGRKN